MKQAILFPLILLFIQKCYSRETQISIKFIHAKTPEVYLQRGDYTNPNVLFSNLWNGVNPIEDGEVNWKAFIDKPIFLRVYVDDTANHFSQTYVLYLTPGNKLQLTVDCINYKNFMKVQGDGAAYNQPELQRIYGYQKYLENYYHDSIPNSVIRAIVKVNNENQRFLARYTKKHPIPDSFMNLLELYCENYIATTFIQFKGSQKFNIDEAVYFRNENYWQHLEDSLLSTCNLSNPALLELMPLSEFLMLYPIRIKERIWHHPELAFNYFTTLTPELAKQELEKDPENLLSEKIIYKHFKGEVAEFLMASHFRFAFNIKEENLPEIYERFKTRYPASKYLAEIEPVIQRIIAQRKNTLNSSMTLIEDLNAFETFQDLLDTLKGKAVLVDMWGTWCGTYRQQLAEHSEKLKAHFSSTGLEYVYIANYDTFFLDKWKELIAYYQLSGLHILASNTFTENIMSAVKGTGYPTYILVRKDGSFIKIDAKGTTEEYIEEIERGLK